MSLTVCIIILVLALVSMPRVRLVVTSHSPTKLETAGNTQVPEWVPILEYHDTAYRPNWPWALEPGQFQQEMAWLYAHHFHTVTLDQLYDAMRYHAPLPSRPVVITFDDGHVSNYTMALPILKKYHFVATEFVVTGAINRPGFLSRQQLLEMQNSGVFTIGCHTVHHPYLAKLPPDKVKYEVTASKQELQQLLGRPVEFFCYPYGSYNKQVVAIVQQAGYKLAVTSNFGYASTKWNGRLTLRRMSVHEGLSLATFQEWLSPSLYPWASPRVAHVLGRLPFTL